MLRHTLALSALLLVAACEPRTTPSQAPAADEDLTRFSGATVRDGVLEVPDFGLSVQLPAACEPADQALDALDLVDVPEAELWRLPCPPEGPDSPGPEVALVLTRESAVPRAGEVGLETVRILDAHPSWPADTMVDAEYRFEGWAPGVWHRALERRHRGWFVTVLVVHDESMRPQVDALVESFVIR